MKTVPVTEPITVISVIKDDTKYDKNVRSTLVVDEYLTTKECNSAPEALNAMIEQARNDLIVISHDDIIFPPDWAKNLRLPDDPDFGLLGVWGNDMNGELAGHVIEPRGHWKRGDLPAEVQSLDELLTIIRKSSGLRFDETLDSFTLYAVDMCLQAMRKGKKNYAIDACITHTSMGVIDNEFMRTAGLIQKKWDGNSKIKNLITPNITLDLDMGYKVGDMLGGTEDMHEHQDYLTHLATGMDTVVEFGVRYGCSTRSFIKAKPKRLLSYDIVMCSNKDELSKLAEENGVEWAFTKASTHDIEIPECDLLLVDAEHTYASVKRELELHKNKAKLIAFHDTVSFPDINRAIDEECGEWERIEDSRYDNGLLVIKNPTAEIEIASQAPESDMNIVIGIPTGGRSQQAAEVVKSWAKKGIDVCITTWDDITFDLFRGTHNRLIKTDKMESFAANQNMMMAEYPDWDVWICGADDLWSGGQYDLKDRIEVVAEEAGNRLIWVADGCLNAQPTHPIITRKMYEVEGPKILCEDYQHNFVDTDLFARMLQQTRVVKCFDIVLDHRHPINKTADQDDIYAIGGDSYPKDAILYHTKWGNKRITINDVQEIELEQVTN